MAATLTRRALMAAAAAVTGFDPATAAPAFAGHAGVRSVITAGQSAVCNVADLGRIQTLAVVLNGVLLDVHACRNGIYQAKDPVRSRSLRAVAPVDVNRLVTAAGGLDQAVNGTPRAAAFNAILSGSGGAPSAAVAGLPSGTALRIAPDAFFDDWLVRYDAGAGIYAFAARGVQALWKLEGNP